MTTLLHLMKAFKELAKAMMRYGWDNNAVKSLVDKAEMEMKR